MTTELNIPQVAELMQVCPATARRMARKGIFHGAYRIGRDWRIPETAIERAKDKARADASTRVPAPAPKEKQS